MVTKTVRAESVKPTATKVKPTAQTTARVVPPQKKNKLDEALATLQSAQEQALNALGIAPISPVRKFINFICAAAAAGGAYWLVIQLVDLLVAAAALYIGISFITFLVAFVGLAAALFITWQTYAVSRQFLDGVAMGTIKPTEVVAAGWSRFTGMFSRNAEPALA